MLVSGDVRKAGRTKLKTATMLPDPQSRLSTLMTFRFPPGRCMITNPPKTECYTTASTPYIIHSSIFADTGWLPTYSQLGGAQPTVRPRITPPCPQILTILSATMNPRDATDYPDLVQTAKSSDKVRDLMESLLPNISIESIFVERGVRCEPEALSAVREACIKEFGRPKVLTNAVLKTCANQSTPCRLPVSFKQSSLEQAQDFTLPARCNY
jgi:hypothetical protein